MRICKACKVGKKVEDYRGNRVTCKKCENGKYKKRKYSFFCVVCGGEYSATKQNEKRKKNKGYCHSCSTSKAWKNEEYRKIHIKALKEAHNREGVLKKHSEASKRNFENEEFRQAAIVRLTDPEARKKATKSIRKSWRDPIKSKRMLGKMFVTRMRTVECSKGQVSVKSGYEERLIHILDKHGLVWYYEPRVFELKSLGRVYIPDFYVEDFSLWIEVKGYWYKDAKDKWEAWNLEYPDLKKVLIQKKQLLDLENGAIIEDYINRKNQ